MSPTYSALDNKFGPLITLQVIFESVHSTTHNKNNYGKCRLKYTLSINMVIVDVVVVVVIITINVIAIVQSHLSNSLTFGYFDDRCDVGDGNYFHSMQRQYQTNFNPHTAMDR